MALIPPHLFFKFDPLFFTLFKGSPQDPSVEMGLACIEKRSNVLEESSKHMTDDSQIPEPFTLQALFQGLSLCGFLLCTQRF
jgi:hypothetical protein